MVKHRAPQTTATTKTSTSTTMHAATDLHYHHHHHRRHHHSSWTPVQVRCLVTDTTAQEEVSQAGRWATDTYFTASHMHASFSFFPSFFISFLWITSERAFCWLFLLQLQIYKLAYTCVCTISNRKGVDGACLNNTPIPMAFHCATCGIDSHSPAPAAGRWAGIATFKADLPADLHPKSVPACICSKPADPFGQVSVNVGCSIWYQSIW